MSARGTDGKHATDVGVTSREPMTDGGVADETPVDDGARPKGTARRRSIPGILVLALVPVLLASTLVAPIVVLSDGGPFVGALAAVILGLGVSAALGPVLVERRIDRLPAADLDDRPRAFIEHRIDDLADAVGVDAPTVRIVRGSAANVAVADGYRGARIVVSTRLLSQPRDDRDAALRHALVRLRRREAAVTTALLPAAAFVETMALFATLLVGRRNERTAADRRVNRIHGYEPERERIPGPIYVVTGVVLWLLLIPIWIPVALGDRLHVAEGRRTADAAVARAGRTERAGLANAITFARDAAGAADWPPILDRLSLVSMADEETERVRGTTRQEGRLRLARLRSKRTL